MQGNYLIYIHRNKINNKAYIGQTSWDVRRRWENGSGYKHCTYFYNAIQKYGWDNFEHIIWADGLTAEEANHIETLLIALFETNSHEKGYNLRSGGKNASMHEDSKQKISATRKGQFSGKANPAARAVAQYDKDNNLIHVWDYARQAADELNIHNTNISSCCRGKLKTAGGFIWRYI